QWRTAHRRFRAGHVDGGLSVGGPPTGPADHTAVERLPLGGGPASAMAARASNTGILLLDKEGGRYFVSRPGRGGGGILIGRRIPPSQTLHDRAADRRIASPGVLKEIYHNDPT